VTERGSPAAGRGGVLRCVHSLVLTQYFLLLPSATCVLLCSLLLLLSVAVLKLEGCVLEFLSDSSKASLEFPGSTSNYEVRGVSWDSGKGRQGARSLHLYA
jgi:hypothetical protein